MSNLGSWAAVPHGRLSKLPEWSVAQRSVRSALVIVLAPSSDLAPGVVKRKEPVGVQALIPQTPVEGLDQGIAGRLAWPAEVKRDLMQIGPLIQRA